MASARDVPCFAEGDRFIQAACIEGQSLLIRLCLRNLADARLTGARGAVPRSYSFILDSPTVMGRKPGLDQGGLRPASQLSWNQ